MITPLGRIIRAQGLMITPLGRIIRAQGLMITPLGRINETHSKNPNKKGPKIGPSLLLLTENCFVK
jgi:hypothetical protein